MLGERRICCSCARLYRVIDHERLCYRCRNAVEPPHAVAFALMGLVVALAIVCAVAAGH